MRRLFASTVLGWQLLLSSPLSAQQPPVPVPAWAAEAIQGLRPISAEAYQAILSARQTLIERRERIRTEADKASYSDEALEAMRFMARQKEATAQALIWMYVDDRFPQDTVSPMKESIPRSLTYDHEAAPMMLPVVKARLSWLVDEMERGVYNTSNVSETSVIVSYLAHQGEVADLKPITRLVRVYASPHPMASHIARWTDEAKQRASFADVREFTAKHSCPVWRSYADFLIEHGYDTASSLGLDSRASDAPPASPSKTQLATSSTVVSTRKSATESKPMSFNDYLPVIFVAAIMVAVLFWRKRGQANN